ncbi:MAG: Uma2 family endonuclease [Pseudonocardia sp.]|nr:Uma2 family endonuclease [Pseudonocardia sp.]
MAVPSVVRHHMTLREFLLAWEAGAFGKRTELLDGEVWDVTIGDWHGDVTMSVGRALPNATVTVTSSSLASGASLPQPDCWARRKEADPIEQLSPRMTRWAVEDVLLVVEVSDETREYDLGRKAEIYAEAGFAHYWSVCRDGVYAHSEPISGTYRHRTVYKAGDRVPVPYAEGVELPVEDLIRP